MQRAPVPRAPAVPGAQLQLQRDACEPCFHLVMGAIHRHRKNFLAARREYHEVIRIHKHNKSATKIPWGDFSNAHTLIHTGLRCGPGRVG